MEIIKKTIKEKLIIPHNLKTSIKNKNYCFLDIETTGLSRKKNSIILIGLLFYKKNKIITKQFFANSLEDEYSILNSFKTTISKFDMYITYNGDAFDIPFLNYRLNYYGVELSLKKDNNLDLLKIVRKNKNILKLKNCKLKTVEKKLGINRKDTINGRESIKMYFQYLKNNDNKIKKIILTHNYEDIYHLSKIIEIYDRIHKYYTITIYNENKTKYFSFTIDNIYKKNTMLNISCYSNICNIPNQIYYYENYSIEWNNQTKYINLMLQLYEGILSNNSKCYYLNKNDYNFKLKTIDQTTYELPKNIILISDNNKHQYENIKSITSEFIENVLNKI